MREYSVLGKSLPKKDALEKVCGQAKYTGDLVLNHMLCGKILRSPHAHARIVNINTSKAEKLKGVKAVVTGKDITNISHGVVRIAAAPPWLRDKFPLAKGKVRYIGDEVAAVAAIDEHTALAALDLIEVEYEVLPAVFDVFEAMKPGVPRIHDHAENNISLKVAFHFGDVEAGFKESDLILEEHFETQYVCHAPLETHTALADFSQSGAVTLWLSTQIPFNDQQVVAETLGIPLSKVRVIKPHVGGGFGAKADSHAPFAVAAVLSRKAGQPVKICNTREEEIVGTARRHPTFIEQKIGVKKDGTIMAVDSRFVSKGGAYNHCGPATIFLHGAFQNGPYKVKNFKYDGTRVYTNETPSTAQRGHGGIQARFVVESMMDMIAEKLGIDPLEIRIKNGLKVGDVIPSGATINSCGHEESIEKARREIGWQDKWGKLPDGKGVGVACGFFCSGVAFNPHYDNPPTWSAVTIEGREDGTFTLLTGSSDIGQGSMTTLAQIVAEEVGVNLDDVNVIAADTAVTPIDLGSFSSRVTLFAGNATKMAATEMRKILLAMAASKLEANPDDLDARGGRIYIKGNPDQGVAVSEAIRACFAEKKDTLTTKGHYEPPNVTKELRLDTGAVNITPAWTFGAHTVEVEVDKETGIVTVKNIAAAHDCGFAINPMSVEGQVEGAVSMAFGQAFLEDAIMKNGHTLNPSFLGYTLPTALDNPPTTPIIVEAKDKEGPYGAKEASEGANVPTIPAIANAIYDAIGVRIKDLPITPEKILKGLKERDKMGV